MTTPSSQNPAPISTDVSGAAPAPASHGSPAPSRGHRPGAPGQPGGTRWPLFLLADLVLVVVFAAIGRASHGEDAAGALATAWPFLVGALVGWLASRGTRRPAAVIPTGLAVWICAEVGGMVLRAFTGQGTALAFVVVSMVVLGVFLIGYRLLVAAVVRLRRG